MYLIHPPPFPPLKSSFSIHSTSPVPMIGRYLVPRRVPGYRYLPAKIFFRGFLAGKEQNLSLREIYDNIREETKGLSFSTFMDEVQELYEALRKADVLLLKNQKRTSIKYPWEDLLGK